MQQNTSKNWWGRNWKWFVPVGCLGCIMIFASFIVLLGFLIFGIMKSSDIYQEALAKTKANTSVQKSIGTPIQEGMFVTGNMETSGTEGQADIAIPISGPNGKAIIHAVAEKSLGQWRFSALVVEIEKTKQRIDLLEDNTPNTLLK